MAKIFRAIRMSFVDFYSSENLLILLLVSVAILFSKVFDKYSLAICLISFKISSFFSKLSI
jgi:hypothetical protein